MKFVSFLRKELLLILFILCLVFLANGQGKTQNDNDGIADPAPVNVFLNVSVKSSKVGYLKNLDYKSFEVYDEKFLKQIEFFRFDELKNQYIIGFYPDTFPTEKKWHRVKIRLILSAEKKNEYGKILIIRKKVYYPNQN